jgi:hypothetical protein
MMGWMAPLRHLSAKLLSDRNSSEWEPSMGKVTTIGLGTFHGCHIEHGLACLLVPSRVVQTTPRHGGRPPWTSKRFQLLTILPRIVPMSACVNARRVCVRTFPRAPVLNPSAVMEIS